jgi:hypothetical protein
MRHLDRPEHASGLLDWTMPRLLAALILIALSVVPVVFVVRHYHAGQGLTQLVLFGSDTMRTELPEIKALNPMIESSPGYDGQHYATLAMDPTFRRPDLVTACPQIHYRAQRYLPIVLAYLLGFGQPKAIVTMYVLENVASWFGLMALLVAYFRGRTPRQYLCLAACLLTTGSLICIARSLGDLMGSTLALASVLVDGLAAASLLALAVLCKPTFVLALARYLWPLPANRREFATRAALIAVTLAPVVVLFVYLWCVLGPLSGGRNNWGLPLVAWTHKEIADVTKLLTQPFELHAWGVTESEWRIFEILVPLALLIQVSHLAIWRDARSALWWLGVVFGLLFFVLGPSVTAEEIASARSLLPLTLVFNLRLAVQRGPVFWFYFLAGNLPLLWCARSMFCSDVA